MATTNCTADELMRDGTVTVAGAKDEYGLSRSRLYQLMTTGCLPYSQIGAKRYMPRRAIIRLLEAGMVGGVVETDGRR